MINYYRVPKNTPKEFLNSVIGSIAPIEIFEQYDTNLVHMVVINSGKTTLWDLGVYHKFCCIYRKDIYYKTFKTQ